MPEEKPILQTAEFWLGQIKAIAELESKGLLTVAKAMKAVKRTLQEMKKNNNQPTE
jgi:hypothetical protein